MRLYYFKAARGNFGDDLNAWLWPRLLGADFFDPASQEQLVGIGTLLNHRVPPARRTLVFGSGYGYGSRPALDASWHFFCVRGPGTARELGLAPELAITDPAILIYEYTREAVRPVAGRIGFIPHCDSAEAFDWRPLCERAGLFFIDSRGTVDEVIAAIGSCERVLTEAMHGAIFADAMRVPWVAVHAYPHISAFKWKDWCDSMALDYAPQPLQPLWAGEPDETALHRFKQSIKRGLLSLGLKGEGWTPPEPARSSRREQDLALSQLKALARRSPQLSEEAVHTARRAALHERLEQLREYRRTGQLSAAAR